MNAPSPLFDSTDAASLRGQPRLLLLSQHFPPGTAVGGLRWQRIARYVVAHGWGLDVLTSDPRALATTDPARLNDLPANVRVYGVMPGEPKVLGAPAVFWRLFRRLVPDRAPRTVQALSRSELSSAAGAERQGGASRIAQLRRAYFARVDFARDAVWGRRAAHLGIWLARRHDYVAVASSGPPHMAHEAARLVAHAAGLPLVADFRDPWSFVERVPEHIASPVWFSLAARHERQVVQSAALVVMNTEASAAAMARRYPEAAKRIITIRNGSDDDELPVAESSGRFTIRFAGTIYLDRDPRLVFRAAAIVVRELGLEPAQFGFAFIGDVSQFGGVPIVQMAAEEGLAGYVDAAPPVSRRDALRFLAGGTMLLNLPQDSDLAIPAKIFEYVRFDAWLLILAKEGSATAMALRGSGADVIDPSDVAAMARVIRSRYEQFARGERPSAVGRDGRFDRGRQAKLLLERIAAAAEEARARRR